MWQGIPYSWGDSWEKVHSERRGRFATRPRRAQCREKDSLSLLPFPSGSSLGGPVQQRRILPGDWAFTGTFRSWGQCHELPWGYIYQHLELDTSGHRQPLQIPQYRGGRNCFATTDNQPCGFVLNPLQFLHKVASHSSEESIAVVQAWHYEAWTAAWHALTVIFAGFFLLHGHWCLHFRYK